MSREKETLYTIEETKTALKGKDTNVPSNNLIDRQAAIDAICGECQANCIPCEYFPCGEIKAVQALPSVQPEIITCGDCRYKDDGIDEDGIPFLKCLNGRSYGGTRINDFCSWAERRTDEQITE